MKTAEMYVTGYKAKLKKDTSYKGLWTVSFTLKEIREMVYWKHQIVICTILELNTNCHQCCSVARSLLVE